MWKYWTLTIAAVARLTTLVSATPTPRQADRFTYYDLKTPLAAPCDLDTGPDGAIWGDTFLSNKLFRIDDNGLEEYSIPYKSPLLPNSILPSDIQGRVAMACVVRTGYDGLVYAAAGNRNELVRIDPSTKKIEIFSTGNVLGDLQPFNDAWPGETGMFFSQTTANVISHFNYETTEITSFKIPTPLSAPLGMRTASDGALWFTELLGNKIGRLNFTDGTIKEYPLPLSLATPAVLRVETENRYLWFTAGAANAIGRIDIYTGETETFTNSSPASFPMSLQHMSHSRSCVPRYRRLSIA